MGFREFATRFASGGFMSDGVYLAVLAAALLIGAVIALVASHKSSSGFTPGRVVLAAIIAVLAGAGVTLPYTVVRFQSYKATLYAPYEKEMRQYTWIKPVRSKERKGGRHIIPTVIPIDITRNIVDHEVFAALVPRIKPTTPDSVRTIVWIKRDTIRAGGFLDGSSFMAVDCEVLVFDKATSVQVDSLWFLGDRTLPKTKKQDPMRKPVFGPAPVGKIVAYLDSLSR